MILVAAMPNDDATPRRIIMTAAEVAQYLHVHRGTIYELAGNGQIPFFRIGCDYRFDRDIIDKWMIDRSSEVLLKKSGAAVRAAPKKKPGPH
jgi:excisionase family DNA binding protein